jgi:ribosomal protein L44E
MSKIAFCPKCHKVAYTVEQNGEDATVSQGAKTFIKMKVTKRINLNINCPSGHPNKLTIGEDKEADKIVVGEAIAESITPSDSH